MKKIIILTPDLEKIGGVSIFVNAFKGCWDLEEVYFIRGGKGKNIFSKIIGTLLDLLRFIKIIIQNKGEIFFLNTSMNENAFKRDYWFLKLLKLFKVRPNVFIHGFKESFFDSIVVHKLKIFENSQNIFVLSKEHRNLLKSKINFDKIYVETTVADNTFIENKFPNKHFESDFLNVLFLGRLEKRKGIWPLLKAFELLHQNNHTIKLEIVGHGNEETEVLKWLESKRLSNITFSGKKVDIEKIKAYNRNQIYILPSDIEGEGLPITIIEALFSGMIIITTKVGGVADFFENEKMGFFLNSNNQDEIYEKLTSLLKISPQVLENISNFNKNYASNNFRVDIVAKRMKNIMYGTSTNN